MLVDTSVWVDHLRRRNDTLADLLDQVRVRTHPFVIGELACGNLANRQVLLDSLNTLPSVTIASHDEVLRFVESHRLMGRGLGWVDMHLLAAATLTGIPLWTADRRLAAATRELGVHFEN